jgi:hypothetical protein
MIQDAVAFSVNFGLRLGVRLLRVAISSLALLVGVLFIAYLLNGSPSTAHGPIDLISRLPGRFSDVVGEMWTQWFYGPELSWFNPRCFFRLAPEPYSLYWYQMMVTRPGDRCRCVWFASDLALYASLFILITVLSPVCAWLYAEWVEYHDPIGNSHVTRFVAWLRSREPQPRDPAVGRNVFDMFPSISVHNPSNHTHPKSAAARNNASMLLRTIVTTLGMRPYMIQMSRTDQRKQSEGCRSHYWVKDGNVEPRKFDPPANAAFVYIDVDQYLDMEHVLAWFPTLHLIYTFQPASVAKNCGEFTFTFDASSYVTYTVSGGASYRHLVWNYAGDIIRASSFNWAQF